MPLRHRHLTMLALLLGGSVTAWAEGADDLRLSAALGLVHDSNLFRLSPGVDTVSLIGRGSAAETIRISTLGARYRRSYSLQRVEFDVRWTHHRYQNFDYLSFQAAHYRAAWNWSYTPHLYGVLRTTREQSPNSFVDFRVFDQRNLRTDTATAFDATYELDARWRLQGVLSRSARSNSLPITTEADYRLTGLRAGVLHALPSGSSAGYHLHITDGSYTTRASIASAGLFDTGYTQTDNLLAATWAISRDTRAESWLGHRRRSHPNYPQRNFDGLLGSASVHWAYSARSGLLARWERELDRYETARFNYTQTDRFSIGPVWQVSPKATVRLQLEHAVRDFKGAPAGFVGARRRDTDNHASVAIDWEPYRFMLVSASVQNQRRASTAPGFGFSATVIHLGARLTY